MANKASNTPYESTVQEEDDLSTSGATQPTQQAPTSPTAGPKDAPAESHMVEEEVGQVSAESGESEAGDGGHEEEAADGTESAEEFIEASAEQLASRAPVEQNAFSDLQSIEGFEEYSEEESAGGPAQGYLSDAGAEAYGDKEFLPFIAAAASKVLPVLASRIGPTVARAVSRRLSGRAKSLLRKRRRGGGFLATISKLFEAAEEAPGFGEASAETVDEALVSETAQLLEVIIGTDDRVRITNTRSVPWRRICALRIHMPSGAIYRGTGFLIGRRTVATAGHCVYLHSQGGWAKKIEVIPGANGADRPFGQATSSSFRSVRGWVKNKVPAKDYGCIVLPTGAFNGQNLGRFGFGAFPAAELLARSTVLAGYPGDKPFAEMWGMGRKIKTVTATQLVYDHDTMGGQSGAPKYIKYNGKRYVVGIHNYGASSGNSATRVTVPVFNNLKRWSQL